jgi:transcriptional regulator with XRE-family HTH domain
MAREEQQPTEADSPQGSNGNGRALHRLAMVRRLQGISRRTVARRMHVEVADVRSQEDPASDLPISQLYQWQQALEVPVSELLVESEDALSQPLMRRAQLVRLMKTALAIRQQVEEDDSMGVLAQTLIDQLVQVMPELSGISAWHAVGKRRRPHELGIAAQRSLSDDVFIDLME